MPDEWWLTHLGIAEPKVREELKTEALCDAYLEDIAFAAGRMERRHRELMAWAESEGDEATVVELHQLIERHRAAVNEALGFVKRWRATLEASAK